MKGAKREHRKLAELRRKIERGTENLALADKNEFAAISKLLSRWHDEEFELSQRLEEPDSDLKPLPDALKVLGRLAEIHENLAKANVSKLADAISKTIADLSIQVRETNVGSIEYREIVAELIFHDAFGIDPIVIPDEVLGQRRIWRELGVLVADADRPLHLKDFCEYLGTTDPSHAAHHLRRTERAGLIRKIGHQGGWVPASNFS